MQSMIQWIVVARIKENDLMLNVSDFPWAECSITENRVMYQNDSLSLKRSKRSTGVHRYEFELVTTEMKEKVGRGVMAKLSSAVDDTITFVHPRFSFSQGVIPTLGLEVVGTSLAGSKSVNIVGVSSGDAWALESGDYIQFGNDTKVYQVAIGASATSGYRTIELTSELRKRVDGTELVIANDVIWYLESNGVIETSMQASDDQDMELTLVAVEKL